jgi:AraC family transcriptional regulator of adaptative response/methylated-DNA-[protein]-cysteine methyltransferase
MAGKSPMRHMTPVMGPVAVSMRNRLAIWDHLRTIPEGQTAHYGDIATAIGKPTAARAVARACATNPVALVVPCHRVVPKTGGVGGYRWGANHKKRLLEMEKEKTRDPGPEGMPAR